MSGACLARSLVRDGTDALFDVRPPDRLDDAAGTLFGFEGRRASGTAPGSRGAAAAEPEAEAGLGRPGGDGRAGPAPAGKAASAPAGHPRHHPALAPPPGHPEVDLPNRTGRPPVSAEIAALIEQLATEN